MLNLKMLNCYGDTTYKPHASYAAQSDSPHPTYATRRLGLASCLGLVFGILLGLGILFGAIFPTLIRLFLAQVFKRSFCAKYLNISTYNKPFMGGQLPLDISNEFATIDLQSDALIAGAGT